MTARRRTLLWRLGLSGELVRRRPVRTVMDCSRMSGLYVKDSGETCSSVIL